MGNIATAKKTILKICSATHNFFRNIYYRVSKPVNKDSELFIVGEKYTRKDVYEILEVPPEKQGGNWATGYTSYEGQWYVFANIQSAGRTGHDYDNHWKDGSLVWYGKSNRKLENPSSRSLVDTGITTHIFTRDSDRAPFTYQGLGIAEKTEDTKPFKVIWRF